MRVKSTRPGAWVGPNTGTRFCQRGLGRTAAAWVAPLTDFYSLCDESQHTLNFCPNFVGANLHSRINALDQGLPNRNTTIMAASRSPYDLLCIERSANLEDIKRAYRSLAKQLHPDLNAGDDIAAEKFKEITAAYNLLADRKKRAEFDLNMPTKSKNKAEAKPWQKGGEWFDFEIDESTGERTIDLFGDVAGTRLGRVKGAAATSLWMKGEDIAETLEVTNSEANQGICKLITTMTGLTVAVDIPKSAMEGDIVTLRGFGIEGFGGGPPGDLNVILSVVPDPSIEA